MPGFDGTGPMGMGPMTGDFRGLYTAPRVARRFPRFGGCWQRGGGLGWGRGWRTPISWEAVSTSAYQEGRDEEINFLRNEAEAAKEELKRIESKLEQLEKEKSEAS